MAAPIVDSTSDEPRPDPDEGKNRATVELGWLQQLRVQTLS